MDHPDFGMYAGRSAEQAVNLAEIFVRGTARMLELQGAAARTVLQTQGRSAALFGAPDWSVVFNGGGNEQFQNLFETGAEQAVRFLRIANETIQQFQSQLGVLIEQQTQQATEQMRHSIEEMARRSEQTIQQLTRLSGQVTDQARGMAEEAGRAMQRPLSDQGSQPAIITPGTGTLAGTTEGRARARA
jgi:DNA anti-recombination protein RmuC